MKNFGRLVFCFSALISITSAQSQAAGSLWCALLATPTELQERRETPYNESQIDWMNDQEIQVTTVDHYRNGETQVARYGQGVIQSSSPVSKIAGIALVEYRLLSGAGPQSLKLALNARGKIQMGDSQYCEIPGDYQADYSKSVKR